MFYCYRCKTMSSSRSCRYHDGEHQMPPSLLGKQKSIHRLVFLAFLRLSTHKESKVSSLNIWLQKGLKKAWSLLESLPLLLASKVHDLILDEPPHSIQVLTSLETLSRNVFCLMCDSKRDIPVVLEKNGKLSASFWSNPNSDCTLCHGNSIFFLWGKIVKIFASGNSGVNWCGYNHWDENG